MTIYNLKIRIEEEIEKLRQMEFEAFAQLHAIQGSIQELESTILPMIETEIAETEKDNGPSDEEGPTPENES